MTDEIKDTETEEIDVNEKNNTVSTASYADEDKIPLDFSYYKVSDNSDIKRKSAILAGCAVFLLIFAGLLKTINTKTNKPLPETEISYIDSYEGSPYAHDTSMVGEGMTESGLNYREYDEHVRIISYRDLLYPYDLTIPAEINEKPVAEIDYYVFSYSVLNSLNVENPECIFFEDGNMPPVDVKVPIVAAEDSKAHEMAEKYGNPFTAK